MSGKLYFLVVAAILPRKGGVLENFLPTTLEKEVQEKKERKQSKSETN